MTAASKRVLVIGGTGTVGKHAVRELLERGATPLVLTRGPRSLPAGALAVVGDTLDAASVDAAVAQAEAVIYVTPHEAEATESRMSQNVLDACARHAVPATYFSVGLPGRTRWTRALFGVLIGIVMPHYRDRIRGAQRAFLHPANANMVIAGCFCQCSDYFIDDILQGSFTEPTGKLGLSRVDAYDIGAALAVVALRPKGSPRAFEGVEGAEAVTGPQAAAIWAAELGRPVTYAGHNNDRWQQSLARSLQQPKLDQYIKTLKPMHFAWVPVSGARVRKTTLLLGRPPRSYRDYVRDEVRALRLQGKAAPPALAA